MSQGGRTKIAELLKSTPAGSEVTAKGWVRTKRGNKNVAFIALWPILTTIYSNALPPVPASV